MRSDGFVLEIDSELPFDLKAFALWDQVILAICSVPQFTETIKDGLGALPPLAPFMIKAPNELVKLYSGGQLPYDVGLLAKDTPQGFSIVRVLCFCSWKSLSYQTVIVDTALFLSTMFSDVSSHPQGRRSA